MKKSGVFCFLIILILGVSSCHKAKNEEEIKNIQDFQRETEETDNAQMNHGEEASEESLFVVSEGRFAPEMVFVEGGEFTMGDDAVKTNQPHLVKLSSFHIAKYMVTTGEWKQFLADVKLEFTWDWEGSGGYGPFYNIVPTDDCPAQGLNWYYAVIFCNWASLKDGFEPCYIINKLPEKEFEEISVEWNKEANGYRLPTDSEWEYAARGGQMSEGYIYPGSNNPGDVGRFGKEYKTSYPVGEYTPNELGIHDMGGNADEWCWDWYDEIMFEWLPVENPSVDRLEDVKQKSRYGYDFKVIRGASWDSQPIEITSRGTYRPKNISMTGIRLVRNGE